MIGWHMRLPEDVREYLKGEATRAGRSMASIVVQSVREFRERQERTARQERLVEEILTERAGQ